MCLCVSIGQEENTEYVGVCVLVVSTCWKGQKEKERENAHISIYIYSEKKKID